MASVVAAVHQTGLGGGADLVQKAGRGPGADLPGVLLGEIPGHNIPHRLLQLRDTVGPLGRAASPRGATDQAAPGSHPLQLASVPVQHIHIKEPPQSCALLQIGAYLFQRTRVHGNHIHGLTPGHVAPGLPMQDPIPGQPVVQRVAALKKGAANQGRIFYRAGNIHSKADERLTVPFQQMMLLPYPILPGLQNLRQGYFLHACVSLQLFCPYSIAYPAWKTRRSLIVRSRPHRVSGRSGI